MAQFLTVNELADRWRTTPHAVHCLRHRGDAPPATRIGRQLLFAQSDVEAYEKAKREGAPAAVPGLRRLSQSATRSRRQGDRNPAA